MLFLTFSTGLSFHSAGHMCSPQICTPGALGSSMDQCPRICAQNMSQVVSLASRLPSGKCHCLTHISQISSITQATLLPPEETSGLCPCHCAGSCQVRPALFPLSVWLHGISQLPFRACRVPIPPDSAEDLELSSVFQANREAPSSYPKETKERRAKALTKQSTMCISALPAAWQDFDKAGTDEKHWPEEVLLISWQYVRPVAGVTHKQHLDYPPEVSHMWCWLFGSFHPSNS